MSHIVEIKTEIRDEEAALSTCSRLNLPRATRGNRTIVIGLSPLVQIPPELEKMFVVVEHEMPSREQLKVIVEGIATEASEIPLGKEFDQILDAASGLTRAEAESAFSLSLVRHGNQSPGVIWELKAQMLKKSGALEPYCGDASFESLGGLDSLKSFCKRALSRSSDKVKPRGVLLLSPPGCGKSQFCKALGAESGRPVIVLDVGSLMGSLVGQTEQRTRQALRTIDAMAPAIVVQIRHKWSIIRHEIRHFLNFGHSQNGY